MRSRRSFLLVAACRGRFALPYYVGEEVLFCFCVCAQMLFSQRGKDLIRKSLAITDLPQNLLNCIEEIAQLLVAYNHSCRFRHFFFFAFWCRSRSFHE